MKIDDIEDEAERSPWVVDENGCATRLVGDLSASPEAQ
jgi:hypothetical protein